MRCWMFFHPLHSLRSYPRILTCFWLSLETGRRIRNKKPWRCCFCCSVPLCGMLQCLRGGGSCSCQGLMTPGDRTLYESCDFQHHVQQLQAFTLSQNTTHHWCKCSQERWQSCEWLQFVYFMSSCSVVAASPLQCCSASEMSCLFFSYRKKSWKNVRFLCYSSLLDYFSSA